MTEYVRKNYATKPKVNNNEIKNDKFSHKIIRQAIACLIIIATISYIQMYPTELNKTVLEQVKNNVIEKHYLEKDIRDVFNNIGEKIKKYELSVKE